MRYSLLLAAAAALIAPVSHAATVNVATNANVIGFVQIGFDGVLRPGSPWGPGSTPSNFFAPLDGTPQPEGTQWNNGSFWWDADPRINAAPISWSIRLNQQYRVNQLIIQADDNDSYLVEYWDGSAWASLYTVQAVFNPGLRTRDSGLFAPVLTDRFRFSAISGDNYYSLSQFQAFGTIPEPASWAMLIAGFGLVGAAARRRRTVSA